MMLISYHCNDINNHINDNNNQEHLADALWLTLIKIALGESILIDNLFIIIVPLIADRTKSQGVASEKQFSVGSAFVTWDLIERHLILLK